MHTYKINYTTKTGDGQATLTRDHMATHLQIVEAVARHCHPDERQEIGDVFDKADLAGAGSAGADLAGAGSAGADLAGAGSAGAGSAGAGSTGLNDHLKLMAEWDILAISYTIDDELEEHQL